MKITLKIPSTLGEQLRAYAAGSGLSVSRPYAAQSQAICRRYASMAERRQQRDVRVEYSFDRLLVSKLEQVYQILVPDRVRIVGNGSKLIGPGDEDSSDLRPGILGQAEGGEHH